MIARSAQRAAAIILCLGIVGLAGCSSSTNEHGGEAGRRKEPTTVEDHETATRSPAQVSLTQEALDELLAADAQTVPASPGQIVHVLAPARDLSLSSATGVMDRASGVPLAPDATVRIASVTKTFTAASVLRLMEKGDLDLDDSISAAGVPNAVLDLLQADGFDIAAITVRMLLAHTSGIADFADDGKPDGPYGAQVASDPSHIWTPLEQIAFAMQHYDPLSAPGAEFHYSDTGYVILGQLLEAKTGLSYPAAMRSLLGLDSLGLSATGVELSEPVPESAGPRATQYLGDIDISLISPTIDLFGGGGIVTSMDDLAVFFRALSQGGVFEHSSTFDVMTTGPGTTVAEDGGRRGLGIFGSMIDGHQCWSHAGYWGVYAITCPDLDLTITRTINQVEPDDGWDQSSLPRAIVEAVSDS